MAPPINPPTSPPTNSSACTRLAGAVSIAVITAALVIHFNDMSKSSRHKKTDNHPDITTAFHRNGSYFFAIWQFSPDRIVNRQHRAGESAHEPRARRRTGAQTRGDAHGRLDHLSRPDRVSRRLPRDGGARRCHRPRPRARGDLACRTSPPLYRRALGRPGRSARTRPLSRLPHAARRAIYL